MVSDVLIRKEKHLKETQSEMNKKVEKEFSIHTKFGNFKNILITKPSAFLAVVSKKYNIKEDEIEIYNLGKQPPKKIGVEELEDIIRVEIKKRPSLSATPSNGLRTDENKISVEEMCQKLQDRRMMTDQETELLLGHLRALPLNLKRRLESGNHQPPEMKNRKVQANRIDQICAYTQTDKLLGSNPNISTNSKELYQEIKNYAKKEKKDPEKVKQLLTESFNYRRNSIIKDHLTVALLREQYSILFNLSEIRNELDRILSDGTSEKFLANIEKYAKPILSMAKDDDPLLLTTHEKKRQLDTPLQKKYAVEVGSILMLTSLINEQRNFLKLEDRAIDVTTFPYIEAKANLHGLFLNKHIFKVYAEHILICEATDFKEAILCLLACYFIFNIKYPSDNFNTLVVMEKIYLEGIDTEIDDIDSFTQQIIKSLQLKAAAKGR